MRQNLFGFLHLRTLKSQMVVFGLLISLLPLIIYQAITLESSAKTLTNTYAQELSNKTELTSLLIDQAIAHNLSEIRTVAASIGYIKGSEALKDYVESVGDFRNDISSLTILDAKGNVLVTTAEHFEQIKRLQHYPVPLQQLISDAFKSAPGPIFISDAVMFSGESFIYLLTAIPSGGYLLMEMSFSNIALLLANFEDELKGEKHIYLVNRKGIVIYTQDPGYTSNSTFLEMRELLEARSDTADALRTFTDSRGDEVIMSVDQISTFGKNEALGWYLVSFVPVEIITQQVQSTLEVLVLIGLLIILATLLASYTMARGMARPIRKMATMANQLRKGNYSVRITIKERNSEEIDALARTLNDMAEKIEINTRQLTSKNRFIYFILDASPIFMVNVNDSHLEYINRTFLSYLGYKGVEEFLSEHTHLAEVIHQINDHFITPNTPQKKIEAYLQDTQNRPIVYFKNRFGTISSPCIASFASFEDEKRHIYTFTDITQLQQANDALAERANRAEQERKQQQQILEIQSRQAQMGEMIGSIAHQWKQPLNVISVMLADLSESYALGEIDQAYIDSYTKNNQNTIQYMSRTIDDFRNFFQPTNTMRAFDPAQAIENILGMLGKLYSLQNITIQIENRSSTLVLGVVNEFQQVVINILNNAKDAFIERGIKSRRIQITVEELKGMVSIRIEDNAGGIPQEVIERIFDSYFTTKSSDKGTGIGLYMSKQIIEEKMLGRLEVENGAEGACFIITLPKMEGY